MKIIQTITDPDSPDFGVVTETDIAEPVIEAKPIDPTTKQQILDQIAVLQKLANELP